MSESKCLPCQPLARPPSSPGRHSGGTLSLSLSPSLSLCLSSPLQLTWPQLSHHQREINIHIRAQTKYLDHLASLLSASYFSAHSLESREPLQRHVNLLLLQIKLHLEVMVMMVVMVVAGFRSDLRACLSITIIRCLSSLQ